MNLPPILSRALAAQLNAPAWNSQQGLWSNLLQNVRGVHDRGQRFADEAYAVRDMQTVGPQARLNRMQDFLQHGDTTVANPWDRLLFTRPLSR